MFAEDRVLVGVINRKRDLAFARDEHWYRIPQARMPRGINAEYIAFFLSGTVFKERSGGIHYYAEKTGLELVYRKDLLPDQANHSRANDVYYKVQLGELVDKTPPVVNSGRRIISFVYTTWDRFIKAGDVADLYSTADYFVDRIYHALRSTGLTPQRVWQAEYREVGRASELLILCEKGTVVASTVRSGGSVYLDYSQEEDKILAAIKAEIARHGGPVYVSIPVEDI